MAGWFANLGTTKIGQWFVGGMLGYEIGKSMVNKKEDKIVVTVEKSSVQEQSNGNEYFGIIFLVFVVTILIIVVALIAYLACVREQRKNRRNDDRDGQLRYAHRHCIPLRLQSDY